jgi:hypothetical protein
VFARPNIACNTLLGAFQCSDKACGFCLSLLKPQTQWKYCASLQGAGGRYIESLANTSSRVGALFFLAFEEGSNTFELHMIHFNDTIHHSKAKFFNIVLSKLSMVHKFLNKIILMMKYVWEIVQHSNVILH